jgi:YgiT-type zinc finger domain-containing protein
MMVDCVICRRGSRQPGKVTHTIQRGHTIVVVRDVPADVCDVCGEAYFSSEVIGVIERLVEDAVRKGAEVEILRYAA